MPVSAHSRHCRRLISLGIAILCFVAAAGTARAQAAADSSPLEALRANARLEAAVDSLRQGLHDHRRAENYLDSALEEQANRFAVLVGVIVTVLSGVTFGSLAFKMHRTKAELLTKLNATHRAHEAGRQEVEAWLAESDVSMHRAAGNAYVAIATIYEASAPGQAVAAWLLAAGHFYAGKVDPGLGARILRHARGVLVAGVHAPTAMRAQLKGSERLWRDAFKLLHRWAGSEVQDEVSPIHARILELLRDPSESPEPGAAAPVARRAVP